MKHTQWLGAALCAALAACSAMPPSDTPPASAAVVSEPQRATAVRSPMPAPIPAPMKDELLPEELAPLALDTSAPVAVAVEPARQPSAVAAAVAAKPVLRAAPRPAPVKPAAAPAPAPASKAPAKAATRAEAAPSAPVAAPSTAARSLTGRMELVGSARQAVIAAEAADGVVYFLPKAGTAKPKPDRFSIDTHSKGFLPGSLVVPVGSTVAFPNRDEILHNVYSATPGTTFDLGTYGPGQSRSARFGKAGLVLVACNVHHGMRGNVLVLETPHYTRPGRDGRFELKNLPAGPGTLVFWHPRAVAQSRVVAVPTAPVSARLTAVRARVGAK